ncbi:MAG TPA: hypothetical protein VM864_02095 [Pyrinomonadaceae bacterium]|jgi:hypothetical protein|nr:hypothetical protein [Pyrinomonadaceae bacterium]
MNFLNTHAEREEARLRLCELLGSRGEWFCAESAGARGAGASRCAGASRGAITLRAGEWELRASNGALHFSYWAEAGARAWRVAAWEWAGGKLSLRVTRRLGAERAVLELVPRASAREGALVVAAARRAACERLAEAVRAHARGMVVESVRLSAGARRTEPGRYARVLLRRGRGELIAATGAVVNIKAHEIDSMLASALTWWSRAGEGRRVKKAARAPMLWLVVSRELSGATAQRVSLLREGVRDAIRLFESDGAAMFDGATKADDSTESGGEEASAEAGGAAKKEVDEAGKLHGTSGPDGPRPAAGLIEIEVPRLESLLGVAPRFRFARRAELSDAAARLVALAPESVDVIRARHGETVRFRGLPFARVRRLPGGERVWFGVPGAGAKVLLEEGNWRLLAKLCGELAAHRRADAEDKRHAFYRAAPEAWLESLLRRDVTRLDPGLVVSPLHVQLRTSREAAGEGSRPVDLLALRRDGRLVVIELKVSEDAALPIQGADYWRRVSAHHRAGHIRRARLFGDAEISEEPPLVYLVAPLLRFHRSFQTLARCVAPEIELYRFDINEDWRAGVRVARRERVV